MRLLYLRRLGTRLRLRRRLRARLGSRLLRLLHRLRMELGARLRLRARFRPWLRLRLRLRARFRSRLRLRLRLRARFRPWLHLRLRLRTEFLRTRFRLRLRANFWRAWRLLGSLGHRCLMRYLAYLLGLLRVQLLLRLRMKLLSRLLRKGRITRLLRRTMLLRLPLHLLGHRRVRLRPGRLSTRLTLPIRVLSCDGRLSGVFWSAVRNAAAGLRRTRHAVARLWPRIGHLCRRLRTRLSRSTLHAGRAVGYAVGYAGERLTPAVRPGFDWPLGSLVVAARHRARRVRLD